MDEEVVTEAILPDRTEWKTESRGSAFCLTGTISGRSFEIALGVLLATRDCRDVEKSDSDANDDCTDTTTSLEMYAIRATIRAS